MIRLPLGIFRKPTPVIPSDETLRRLGNRVLSAVRDGGRINPGDYVHQQMVAELGGSQQWEELVTPLRQLPPFAWPS